MRNLIFAVLAFTSLPTFAGSLDDFIKKPDEEIAALKLTRVKMNSILAHASKSITLDSVIIKPHYFDADSSYNPGPLRLDDGDVLPTSLVKCTLQQVAELKAVKVEDVAGHKVSYHIQVSRLLGYQSKESGVWVTDNGEVDLRIGLRMDENSAAPCHVIAADQIRAAMRDKVSSTIEHAAANQRREKAQEHAPANENELIEDMKDISFHPGGGHEAPPKYESIDL